MPDVLRPHRLLCLGLGGYYGGGALVVLALNGPVQMGELLADGGADAESLVLALALVLGFVALLDLTCALLPKATALSSRVVIGWLETLTPSTAFFGYAAAVLGVQAILLATGKLGLSGLQIEEGSHRISPAAALAQPFSMSLLVLGAYGLASRQHRIGRVGVLLAQWALVLLWGRRYTTVAACLSLVGFLLGKPDPRRSAVAVALGAGLVVLVFPFFFALRTAKQEQEESPSLRVMVTEAWHILRTGETLRRESFWNNLHENLRSRPLIVRFLAALVARPREYPGAFGVVSMGALATAAPSAWFPEKTWWMARGFEEYVAYRDLRLVLVQDEANSVLTGAYLEAREWGVFLLVPTVALWIAGMLALVRSADWPVFALAVLALTFFTLLFVEQPLAGWVVAARNALVLWMPGFALRAFVGRWRPVGPRPFGDRPALRCAP
jgi:hypothetical protein